MTKRQAAVKSNTRKVRNLTIVIFVVGLFAAMALTGCSYLGANGEKHMGTVVVKSGGYQYSDSIYRYELIRNGKEIFVAFPVSEYSPTLLVGATYDDIIYTDGNPKRHTIIISSVITHDDKALKIEDGHDDGVHFGGGAIGGVIYCTTSTMKVGTVSDEHQGTVSATTKKHKK